MQPAVLTQCGQKMCGLRSQEPLRRVRIKPSSNFLKHSEAILLRERLEWPSHITERPSPESTMQESHHVEIHFTEAVMQEWLLVRCVPIVFFAHRREACYMERYTCDRPRMRLHKRFSLRMIELVDVIPVPQRLFRRCAVCCNFMAHTDHHAKPPRCSTMCYLLPPTLCTKLSSKMRLATRSVRRRYHAELAGPTLRSLLPIPAAECCHAFRLGDSCTVTMLKNQ